MCAARRDGDEHGQVLPALRFTRDRHTHQVAIGHLEDRKPASALRFALDFLNREVAATTSSPRLPASHPDRGTPGRPHMSATS
jgi:hypothetical protein